MLPATEVVYDAWYMAVPGHRLKRGQTISKQLLGQSVLIGRAADGGVFALRDICPHRGIPPATAASTATRSNAATTAGASTARGPARTSRR